jgi:hypothetical protein
LSSCSEDWLTDTVYCLGWFIGIFGPSFFHDGGDTDWKKRWMCWTMGRVLRSLCRHTFSRYLSAIDINSILSARI